MLEKCGTEVDDDEVLAELSGEVFLLLVDGEIYTPQQIPDAPDVMGASTAGEIVQPNCSHGGTETASSSASDPQASSRSLCIRMSCTCCSKLRFIEYK